MASSFLATPIQSSRFTPYTRSRIRLFPVATIPIAGVVALRERLPKWLKWVAGVGFCATIFSLLISTYPIVDVAKPKAFAIKLIVTTLFSNTLGLGYLKLRSRGAALWKRLLPTNRLLN